MSGNLTLCSSSSLLESNSHWNKINDLYGIKHSPYGDFISPLLSSDNNTVVIVLFLEDLIHDFNEELTSIQNRYSPFFEAIQSHNKLSSQPAIICFGKTQEYSLLNGVKKDSNEQIVHEWFYDQLNRLKNELDSIYLINLDDVFRDYGNQNIYSDRNWYFARCRLSVKGLSVLINSIFLVLDRSLNAPSKVLALDCDNTIWGGAIGEEGLDAIILGQDGMGMAFSDFQKEVVKLINQGVIVVIASKNNEEDVWKVFDEHNSMQLKRSQIVSYRINWAEKALNLMEIADELDVHLDSFVFWDDNPLERDKMKNLLPQVLTVEPPANVFEWPRFINSLSCFAKFESTVDDKEKIAQYKARANFKNHIKETTNINQYLASINLQPNAISLDDSNLSRAEQLCKKTNQFNLRTIRHSIAEIKKFKAINDDFIFLVSLEDNYGDHGIVALVCLEQLSENSIFIDTFLVSCRVLGRHLESWILSEVLKRMSKYGLRYLIAEFIETEQNAVAENFLHNYGFSELTKDLKLDSDLLNFHDYKLPYYLDTKNAKIPNIGIYEGVMKHGP